MIGVIFGLRLGRWGVVGFSLAGLLLVFAQTAGFYQVAGTTPGARAAFGSAMATLAAQLVALFPPPLRPDTAGGYAEFRGFHPLAVLFAVWALASATGFARGDEERGVVEAALATGTSRIALIASRTVGFALAITVASAAAAAGFLIGVASGHETAAVQGVVEEAALLAAVGLTCYALSLFVAQLAGPRLATPAAGALLLALFLDNSLSRAMSSLTAWRWLSPFRYYDLSQPLPPGGHFDARAFLVLIGISVIAAAAAAAAFTRRDLGASLIRLPSIPHRPSYDVTAAPWWGVAVARGLYERRLGLLAWAAGMAVMALSFVALTKTIVQVLLSIPSLLPYLSIFVHQQLYPAVLGYTWFNVAELMFAAFAITYVGRWSAEDSDGRLEIFLSQPLSRAGIVLERMAVLAAGAVLIAAVSGAVLFYAFYQQGIDLNAQRLTAASLMLVPFALVFAGAGSLLAAWNPRAAVGLLGAFAFASYLDTELGTIYKFPVWLLDLSAFKLFGTPLLNGVNGRNLALMLLLALAGIGSSILAIQRRDVGA